MTGSHRRTASYGRAHVLVSRNHTAGDPGAAVAGWVGDLVVFCSMDDHGAAVGVEQADRARREGSPVACGIQVTSTGCVDKQVRKITGMSTQGVV